jgi:hypothetical protein
MRDATRLLGAIRCNWLQLAVSGTGGFSGDVTEGNEGNEVQAGAIHCNCCNWLQVAATGCKSLQVLQVV